MNAAPLMMANVNNPLEQMRQHQMLAQQATHFQPLNIATPSSDDFYGNPSASATQNFNGSLSKLMAEEGWFTSY